MQKLFNPLKIPSLLGVSIFGRVGEHTHEGNDLCIEMKGFGLINEENFAKSKYL